MVGLEKTASLLARCIQYDSLYTNADSAASKNLEKSILRLYTAILKFLAKAAEILNGEYSQKKANPHSNKALKVELGLALANYIDEVELLEKTFVQAARVTKAQGFSPGVH